jgi:glycosyltransferase involved in cell wall biosynthesis
VLVYNECKRDARVLKEAATLAGAGHDVTIVAVAVDSPTHVEERDGFRILRIRRNPPHVRLFDTLVRITGRRPRPAAAVRAHGGPVATVGPSATSSEPAGDDRPLIRRALGAVRQRFFALMRRGMRRVHRPLMFIDWWTRAARTLDHCALDVVHAHDVLTLPAGVAIARRNRARLVYDAHELYSEVSTLSPRERRTWHRIERTLAPRADATVTVCESIAVELMHRYGLERPLVVLNCPEAPAAPAVRNGRLRSHAGVRESEEPVVLYHGGFAPNRGIETLIEAAGQLNRGHVVLMGWGRIETDLRDLIATRGVGERVRIVPPVDRTELLQLVADADVGVIPYKAVGLNNYYSAPNKLFELIAAGVPIAASRFPELERFVGGLGLGTLFDPDDPADVARAINELLEPARAADARANAREAASRFTWEREGAKLLALYESSSSSRQRGRIASGLQRRA